MLCKTIRNNFKRSTIHCMITLFFTWGVNSCRFHRFFKHQTTVNCDNPLDSTFHLICLHVQLRNQSAYEQTLTKRNLIAAYLGNQELLALLFLPFVCSWSLFLSAPFEWALRKHWFRLTKIVISLHSFQSPSWALRTKCLNDQNNNKRNAACALN